MMAEANSTSIGNKDTNIDFIREIVRDEINYSRKQQRNVKLNKNRLTLGVLSENDEFNEKFVTDVATRLKKKSLDIQTYRKLQNALIQSEQHINAFLKVNNALQGLNRDLSGTSAQSKLGAASCCCNLALGNSKACATLAKYAAPYLINDLESTSEPLAEVCAWTIGNLVSECTKSYSILHAQGCMKSLIRAAQQSSDTLLPAISYASLRYIHAGADFIDATDIIKLGEVITMRYPTVSDIDTMWLLAILSSKPECHEYLIKCTPEVCKYLFEAVIKENENIEKISGALRIICNTISEPTGQVAGYLFSTDVENNHTFLNKLLSHQYIHIRQEALWLLGNIYNHCLDSVQQLVKLNISFLPSLKLAANSFNGIT